MKNGKMLGMTAAALVCLAGTARTANIVTNGSFAESTGWTVNSATLVGYGGGSAYMGQSGSIWQMTDHVIALGDVYHVSWQAQALSATATSTATVALINYTDTGDKNPITGVTVTVQPSSWDTFTFDYTPPAGSPYLGKTIGIYLNCPGNAAEWIAFTDVVVDVVPEPGTLLLASAGLLGLAGGRRPRAAAANGR